MKRLLPFLTGIIVISIFAGCSDLVTPARNTGNDFFGDVPKQTWTVMVHFSIDNNIDYGMEKERGVVSNYLATLESIEASDVNNKINIVVLMDGYYKGSTFKDGYYHLTGGAFAADLVTPFDEVNSGSLAVTNAFTDWACASYPADGYMYSVFNHGSGFNDDNTDGTYSRGIGFDDSANDCLSHYELGQAVSHIKSRIGRNLDLFFPYACLMGGVELAYEVRNSADCLLFSEELFPAYNWSYEGLSRITSATGGVTAVQIGTAFCESAYNYYSGNTGPIMSFTLSLIKLSEIDGLAQAIGTYANAAIADINAHHNQLVYETVARDSFSMMSPSGSPDHYYMDLGDYTRRIGLAASVDASVKSAAAAVTSQLAQCVIHMRNFYYTDATGMTIFHNIWNSPYNYPVNTYRAILTFGTNAWADYIALLDSIGPPVLGPDAFEPDNSSAQAKPITIGAPAQLHTIHAVGDMDFMSASFVAGHTYRIRTTLNSVWMATEIGIRNPSLGTCEISSSLEYTSVNYTCITSGNFFISINEVNSDGIGDYLVDIVDITSTLDAYEPDNGLNQAKPIQVDAPAQERTLHLGDGDWITVALTTGYEYRFATYFRTVQTDTVMSLYNSNMKTLANNNDNGTDPYAAFDYSCPATGNYYIRVNGNETDYGDYLLDVKLIGYAIGTELVLAGTVSIRGWEPFTYVSLLTVENKEYKLSGALAQDLRNLYQNQAVKLKVRVAANAIGPGFPAEVEVLEILSGTPQPPPVTR